MAKTTQKSKPAPVSQGKKEIPKVIRILGHNIKVQRAKLKDGEYGEYTPFKKVIKISSDSNYEEACLTLLHESIHAALHLSGLSEMLPSSENGPDIEEAIVVCLEHALGHIVDIDKLK
jgi:Zn-dependent peptidase ImmA (M78 family)